MLISSDSSLIAVMLCCPGCKSYWNLEVWLLLLQSAVLISSNSSLTAVVLCCPASLIGSLASLTAKCCVDIE